MCRILTWDTQKRSTKDRTILSLFEGGHRAEDIHDNVQQVHGWILAEAARQSKTLEDIFGPAIRQAIDEVIDGPRTGRWSTGQLEKTEKTYIGTKIEIVVRSALNLELRKPLDTEIAGIPVDIKWSGTCSWEIPSEAVDQTCLVLGLDRSGNSYFVGIVRCTNACLSVGKNKDGKRKLSASGRKEIRWLLKGAPLPRNFLADLPDDIRARIMRPKTGQARVRELVTSVQRQPIPAERH